MKCPKCESKVPFLKIFLKNRAICSNCNSKLKIKITPKFSLFMGLLCGLSYFPAAAFFPLTPNESRFQHIFYTFILQMVIMLFIYSAIWKLEILDLIESID